MLHRDTERRTRNDDGEDNWNFADDSSDFEDEGEGMDNSNRSSKGPQMSAGEDTPESDESGRLDESRSQASTTGKSQSGRRSTGAKNGQATTRGTSGSRTAKATGKRASSKSTGQQSGRRPRRRHPGR